jgi:hypothetical protein
MLLEMMIRMPTDLAELDWAYVVVYQVVYHPQPTFFLVTSRGANPDTLWHAKTQWE